MAPRVERGAKVYGINFQLLATHNDTTHKPRASSEDAAAARAARRVRFEEALVEELVGKLPHRRNVALLGAAVDALTDVDAGTGLPFGLAKSRMRRSSSAVHFCSSVCFPMSFCKRERIEFFSARRVGRTQSGVRLLSLGCHPTSSRQE